jgi:hypothetical protein
MIHRPNPDTYTLPNTFTASDPGISQIQQKIHNTPPRLAHKVGRRSKDGWVRVNVGQNTSSDPLNNQTTPVIPEVPTRTSLLLENPIEPANIADESTAAAIPLTHTGSETQEMAVPSVPSPGAAPGDQLDAILV